MNEVIRTMSSILHAPYVSTVAALLVALTAFVLRLRSKIKKDGVPVRQAENKERQFGEWIPKEFTYPTIQPWEEEIRNTKPIPYRPFRWGQYHVTMGIRNMGWDDWIELDNQFEHYHRIRAHRIQTRGEGVIRVLSDDANPGVVGGGGDAAIELVHELAEYLSRRYPTTFKIERHASQPPTERFSTWGWNGDHPIKTIMIVPLAQTYELPTSVDDGARAPERALEISALLVQDDLALMIEGTDGRYYFQAGAICVSGFWRMQDKIGLPLDEIHISGNVPQYKEKLHSSLERFFRRLAVNSPVIRNNYFFQVVRPPKQHSEVENSNEELDPEELAWAETANGPEDLYEHGHAFTPPIGRPMPRVETLRLRSERQTLRRLPYSGAVVFTIRTYLTPAEELGREAGVPGRLASSMRAWTRDVGEYKGRERGGWWDVLLEYLDTCHRMQVERGEIGEEDTSSKYPY